MTKIPQNGVQVFQPPYSENLETGDRMTGVEEDEHGPPEMSNDDDSEAGNEVLDFSTYEGSEAGDVVMGDVNDEDVSHIRPKCTRRRLTTI